MDHVRKLAEKVTPKVRWKKATFGDVNALVAQENNFRLVVENARKAFDKEILPSLQELNIITENDLTTVYGYFSETVLKNARSGKNMPTFTSLVRHKSLGASEDQFFDDLGRVLTAWYTQTLRRMLGEDVNDHL